MGRGPKLAAVGVPGLSGTLEVGLPRVGEVDDPREVGSHLQASQTRARGRERHGREDAKASLDDPPGEQSHTPNLTGFGASAPLDVPRRWFGAPLRLDGPGRPPGG